MNDLLRACIRQFAVENPQYSTPEGAREKCREASGRFVTLLLSRGIANAFVDEFDVIGDVAWKIDVAHKAVQIGTLWIDWTARQYAPDAPWPRIVDSADERS